MSVPRTIDVGGVEVPRIGLGTNRLRTTAENVAFLRAAVEAGLGLIDTAHTYTDGESEAAIGAALSPPPEGVVVATKGGYAPGTGNRDALAAQVEESLRRLRVEAIDLYYLHRVDPQTPLERSVEALAEHVEAGRIRHLGLSQVGVEEIERARQVAPIAAVQNHYNVAERRYEEVVDHCAREGIVFVPYFPLRALDAPVLTEIARGHGATPHQVALAWLLHRSPAMLPIPGTLSLTHLEENLGALELELTEDELDALR